MLKRRRSARWRKYLSKPRVALYLILVALLLTLWGQPSKQPKPESTSKYSLNRLEQRLREGKIKEIDPDPFRYAVTVKERGAPANSSYVVGVPNTPAMTTVVSLAQKNGTLVVSQPQPGQPGFLSTLLAYLPEALLIGLLIYYLANFGPLKRLRVKPVSTTVRFSDVAGCDEAIEELKEIKDFLKDPGRFTALGARVPKGALLFGPPGTGKTLLAKAVAGDADVPFFSISGSEFIEMFSGLGANRVRTLFRTAKENAPAIIFIDELDSVGRSRSGRGDAATREADQTLNQLLTEMDGFTVSEHPVVLIGASNRLDILDPALLRPGRFDRHIAVDPPDRRGRLEILRIHARNKPLAPEIKLERIAIQTAGMTGADLANLLNEAALHATRRNGKRIEQVDLEDALLRVIAGAKKQNRALSDTDRKVVAYHEAGHALVAEWLDTKDKVHKVSIIPRGQSGGQTIYVSAEDVHLETRQGLLDRICVLLAGRASESVVFDEVTSGAGDDLKRASKVVRAMLRELGMGQALGLMVLDEGGETAPERLAAVEEEARQLLDEAYGRAHQLLLERRETLEAVASALLNEETIDRDRFLEIAGLEPDEEPVEPVVIEPVAESTTEPPPGLRRRLSFWRR